MLMNQDDEDCIVTVVIPYFQREPGILRRALDSVTAQELPSGCLVHCIVVDDGSPHPADDEIPDVSVPGQVHFEIVKQVNGGVSAARNAALDRVPAGTRFVACLDSDDVWMPGHLARAIAALGEHSDFYFSNCLVDEGADWFSAIPSFAALLRSRSSIGEDHVECFTAAEMLPAFVADCPSHTSATVYRTERFRHMRFDLGLRSAGEDHLFWFALAKGSRLVAVDTAVTVTRGHGVDLYRSAQSWDSAECLPRLCGNLLKYRRLDEQLDPALLRTVRKQAALVRQELLAVMVRALRARPARVIETLKFLWQHDKLFFAQAVPHAVRMLWRKQQAGSSV